MEDTSCHPPLPYVLIWDGYVSSLVKGTIAAATFVPLIYLPYYITSTDIAEPVCIEVGL